jgi:hypothetical protein
VQRFTVGYLTDQTGKLMENPYETLSSEEKKIHERLDEMLDISKPLIPQVKKMTNREFLAFVARPRYLEDKDGIFLYEDPEYDEAAKTNYPVNLMIACPLVFAYLAYGYSCCESIYQFAFDLTFYYLLLGIVLIWTFIEYKKHRYELHAETYLDPDAPADGDHNAAIF